MSNVAVIVTHSVSLCEDCIMLDANGWDEEMYGRPMPTPEPMGLLPQHLISADDRDHECEGHYSSWGCDGCGSNLGIQQKLYCYRAVKR